MQHIFSAYIAAYIAGITETETTVPENHKEITGSQHQRFQIALSAVITIAITSQSKTQKKGKNYFAVWPKADILSEI